MRAATDEEIENACMTRAADDAWHHLRSQGMDATKGKCQTTIAHLIAEGRRGKLQTGGNDPYGRTGEGVVPFDAMIGSQRLLQATVNAFAMKAMRERISLEEAMATSLYAPAVVASWKAAA